MITSFQIRAARACLNISQAMVAHETEISTATINRLEIAQENVDSAGLNTLKKLITFFEKNGVEFVSENSERNKGAGVRFIPPHESDQK